MKPLISLSILFFLCTTGCYRFPGPDECSTIPATNNPMITKERSKDVMPGVGY